MRCLGLPPACQSAGALLMLVLTSGAMAARLATLESAHAGDRAGRLHGGCWVYKPAWVASLLAPSPPLPLPFSSRPLWCPRPFCCELRRYVLAAVLVGLTDFPFDRDGLYAKAAALRDGDRLRAYGGRLPAAWPYRWLFSVPAVPIAVPPRRRLR